MDHKSYRGEIRDKAASSSKLQARLKQNATLSARDFFSWHFDRLDLKEGMDILDVGCGTGAQAIPMAKAIGPAGSVSAMDLSEESIAVLKENAAGLKIEAVAADMSDLSDVIANQFKMKQYDLAQSAYALYYADDPIGAMDVMRGALKPGGRVAIFVPDIPHGMVDMAARHSKVPEQTLDSLRFGRTVLEPYFRRHFWNVAIHLFHNEITVSDADTFIDMYRATIYHDAAAEPGIRADLDKVIAEEGEFRFQKNGYLIIGDESRRP